MAPHASITARLPEEVPTGLPAIPLAPWGTHVCQFYRTAGDLSSTLVPYFAAGLAHGERCLWITAAPLGVADARAALARAVPDLDERVRAGQIEVIDHEEWYRRSATHTVDEVLEQWLEQEAEALRDGYAGLRITGNSSWVRGEDWTDFEQYERCVHEAFARRRILAVCSYDLARCTPDALIDVVRHHGFALARRDGEWAVVRGATETLATVADAADTPPHDAIVYRGVAFPADGVAAFIADGVRAGEGVMVVVGGEHARAVRLALREAGVDLEAALHAGQVAWFQPDETLPSLLRDGVLDPDRFAAVVPPRLERLRSRFGAVRACGEMVDVLARRGDFGGALALEHLWNELLCRTRMPVLCTYGADALGGPDGPERLHALRVGHRHLHAVEPAGDERAFGDLVTELANRTRALEAEASRRSAAERERDRWRAASRTANSHVERLQRVTSALLSARSASDLGVVVVTTLAEAVGATSALLASAADGSLGCLAETGLPGDPGAALFALGRGAPVDEVLRSGRPVALGTPAEIRARWPGVAPGSVQAFVALPLEAAGVRRGGLAFGFDRPRAFSSADRAFLDDVARQAALALQRAQLLADLEQARARAEDASRAKDEFLAMLGHELRNPLSPMLTVLHLMERRAPDTFRDERGILERQLRHMEHLVDDLLDVSRIVRGKLGMDPEQLELGRIVAEALESAAPLLEARGHRVAVDVPAAGLVVRGDAHRLVQALVNLLTNSAKYTAPGGNVSIAAERRGEVAVLRVSDDGQGIEPALAPRVFDLFVQGPRGLARSEGGLGLGLAITRSVVEMHDGDIQVHSDGPGKGTTFTIELPLIPAIAGAAAARVAPAAPAASGGRVLVVDDNADAAETLADALRCSGYDVRTALDPAAALALGREFLPDVAVVDIGLPLMDGWTLGARLREQQPAHPPSCIAVTGYGMESDRARSREAGFVAHLVKPLDVEHLDRLLGGLVAVAPDRSRRA